MQCMGAIIVCNNYSSPIPFWKRRPIYLYYSYLTSPAMRLGEADSLRGNVR
jgi:hypothetical protein